MDRADPGRVNQFQPSPQQHMIEFDSSELHPEAVTRVARLRDELGEPVERLFLLVTVEVADNESVPYHPHRSPSQPR